MLHWTGAGWAQPARLAAGIDAAVTTSASDAWAFGAPAGDPQGGYIAHFNGTTWSQSPFPVQVQSVSALSASDIWAGGHWTKTAVPERAGEQPGVGAVAWIPGTRSLWALGELDADEGVAILKYGP